MLLLFIFAMNLRLLRKLFAHFGGSLCTINANKAF
jgi:hypothetical protein